MKKQLGLLTLGMALCLVAPVVGQAAGPVTSGSKATITVDGKEESSLRILYAPNITFPELASNEVDAKVISAGDLKVENKGQRDEWYVKAQVGDFSKSTEKLTHTNFTLTPGPASSVEGALAMPVGREAIVSGTGGVVLESNGAGAGTFYLPIDRASVTIPEVRAGGDYEAPITWTMGNEIDS